jgi:1A family penicillin-binding protein
MMLKRGNINRWQRKKGQIKWQVWSRGLLMGRPLSWWVLRLAIVGFISVVTGILVLVVMVAVYSGDLPGPDKVVRRDGFATRILDRNGEIIYEVFNEEKRLPVGLDQVPEFLKLATIAVEDQDFYTHQGFDLSGIVRGFTKLFTAGRAQGGSTLTQQLVKNVLLSSERTLTRKLKEFVLAVQIERKFTKEEILQMYLNEAPYGGTARGVQAAAELYFGKDVNSLNLAEAVILAGLPQRPSYFSPFTGERGAYLARAEHVAERMFTSGYLSEEEWNELRENLKNVNFAQPDTGIKAPHFVAYVQQLLANEYGQETVEGGGLKVTTTLDLDLQHKVQEIVSEEIKKVEDLHITNGASIVLDVKTGEILAMVGSKNYDDPDYDGKFNVVTALRQPGSAIKPVTYVTAFRKGYTPASMLMDAKTEFPGGANNPPYRPVNYDGEYRGPMQLRYALANSINVPAVKLLALVGIREVLKTAYDLGLSSLEPTQENMSRLGLSMTLGGGEVKLIELAGAYSSFANGGFRVEPVAILKVENRNGQLLKEFAFTKSRQILSAEEAWLINDILSDNSARSLVFGLNSLLNITGRRVAVKTGTTNDQRDNWTIGWTPSYLVGVWVGNNDNSAMKKVASGVTGASPIWRRTILEVLNGTEAESWERPPGIVEADVDKISGYLAHDGFESRKEFFIKGSEAMENDPIHVKLRLCKGQERLANPNQIANSQFDEKEYLIFKEDDPFRGQSNINKWQEGILAWMTDHPDGRYHPPSEYCDEGAAVAVNFLEPRNHDRVNSNTFKVRVDPVSLDAIRRIEIYMDGKLISSISSPPWEDNVSAGNGMRRIEVRAWDTRDREGGASIEIGVNQDWDAAPSATPAVSVAPSLTPTIATSVTPIEE